MLCLPVFLSVCLFLCAQLTANTLESGLFILFLVVFALVASGYVLYKVRGEEGKVRGGVGEWLVSTE